MNKLKPLEFWCEKRITIIAILFVIAGLLLSNLSWWFLLLSAAGAVGPGILRELGWLTDKDEFQLHANYRAGYHAYLTLGLLAFVLVAYFRSAERHIQQPEELATLFLVTLWFTWFLSSLISFWGARKAAVRLLVIFGCAWLAFVIAANTGNEWTGWTSLFMHTLLIIPFFGLAWMAHRWPRLAGLLLLIVAGFLTYFLGFFRSDHLAIINQAVTLVLLIGPILASGIALLAMRKHHQTSVEEDDSSSSSTDHES
ncbi:MAG: hypothetical protein JNJ77_17705 [Planctomycetia bacterium]|nr:hypothetical protein [Planctomycetia bacterium]